MSEVLARIEQARAAGLDVAANQYPWAAGANSLSANLPRLPPVDARRGRRDRPRAARPQRRNYFAASRGAAFFTYLSIQLTISYSV